MLNILESYFKRQLSRWNMKYRNISIPFLLFPSFPRWVPRPPSPPSEKNNVYLWQCACYGHFWVHFFSIFHSFLSSVLGIAFAIIMAISIGTTRSCHFSQYWIQLSSRLILLLLLFFYSAIIIRWNFRISRY